MSALGEHSLASSKTPTAGLAGWTVSMIKCARNEIILLKLTITDLQDRLANVGLTTSYWSS